MSLDLTTRHQWFTFVRLLGPYLPLLCAAFPTTLTTTTHSPQQLGAVWHLHLHTDAEGPTFISTTARQSQGHAFYIVTSQSPSGHTNAMAESFFATLKNERVHRTVYPTREHARRDIARYIELRYNSRRRHSQLDYKTPHQVRYEFENRQLAA
jgi:transposase InsO family protein